MSLGGSHPRTSSGRALNRWVPALPGPEYSKSLERGLGILACFEQKNHLLGIAELADRLGMSRSTTHRYVITLERLGLLAQDSNRKYRVIFAITRLGLSAMSATAQDHGGPYMQELCSWTGFGVGLGVLEGPEVWLVKWMAGRHRGQCKVEPNMAAGVVLPAYCTALGKALMAELPAKTRGEVFDEISLKRRTPSTIVSKRMLAEELDSVHESALAVEDEEYGAGLVGIAAPIRSVTGEAVAALCMLASSAVIALSDLVGALSPHLITTADRVSARMGFRRQDELSDGAYGDQHSAYKVG